ncbi:MAG: ATP-binding protein [Acidobacteriota bacterium]|nr:ATP-binding protein [Blastocatellia bacterium]MDW8240466.1 ATP-binding protein [Acidobacteriota bacterium]
MPTEKILIIDDSPIDARFASKILSEAGYTSTIIHDSMEALGVARQLHPDLILLDVTMPKMDGYQVCQQLKADPDTRDIATVLYTIRDQFIDCLRGIEAGADDFIIKTLSSEDFLNNVRKILGERRIGLVSPTDSLDLSVMQPVARTQTPLELLKTLFGSFNKHVRDTMSVFMGAHVTTVLMDRAIEKAGARYQFFRQLEQSQITNLVFDPEAVQGIPTLEILDGFQAFNSELYQLVTKLTRTRLNGAKEARAITNAFSDMVEELNQKYQELRSQVREPEPAPAPETPITAAEPAQAPVSAQLAPECTFDPSGNLIYCNEDFARMLGYSKTDIMARPFTSFLVHESRQHLTRAFDRLVEKGIAQIKLHFKSSDGASVHTDATLTALYDSQGRFAMTRCALQVVPATLLVQEREEEIERLKRVIHNTNEELSSMASIISHDLRQPLHAILVLCQFLREESVGRLDEQAQGYIRSIEQAGGRMKEMIEDLVHYARINAQSNAYEDVSMAQLLGLVEDAVANDIAARGATLKVAPNLPVVRADRERMMELLVELITNALKFNDKSNPIIEVGMVKEDEEAYTFYVKDNGVGIEEPYHESVFRLFHRLGKTEETAGTGAGLAICRRIIESHGGRIWIRSQPGAGTTVFFTLPKELPTF